MTPSTAPVSVASPGVHLSINDNSNPQQGTGLTMTSTEQTQNGQAKGANEAPSKRLNTMRSPPNKKDSRKLFVGGLPADITEDEFRVFFEQFGEVVDSVVMFDRDTQRSRGFGFVTYQSADVANMLLNMKVEGENGEGKPEDSADAPRIGRLVMRGKTCEVKAAEPKESSRSNRRNYQNQGGSSAAPNRRLADKAAAQGSAQPSAPHVTHFHDPHYLSGHHYPMISPSYYPAYHPGMYHGATAYHPASIYAPVAQTAPVLHDGLHQPYGAPMLSSQMEGSYVEAQQESSHAYAAAYGHPHMMHPGYYPPHPSVHTQPAQGAPYPAPGTSPSMMHPAAPGLPTKDD